MAFTMQIESARLAPCGDIVHITWRSPTVFPGNWGTPDWKEGHRVGRWFDVAGRTKVQHVFTTPFVAANGTVEWQTFLYVPQPIVYGTASAALSVDAGLLTDKYGNSNAGVSSFPIDVTATLVDATGFLDPAVAPPPGVPTLFIDPVNGSDSRTFNQAKAAGAATPVKTFKKASDLAIANGHQGTGVHFRYLQGQAETRTHLDPYNVIQTWGPSPDKPCIIAPCALDGTAPTARAVIRLSNSGVDDAQLYGFVREGGGSNPSDTPNVAVVGFDIKVTDQSGSSIGSAFKILNGATNLFVSDCIIERSMVGFDVQAKTPNICIHKNVILDTLAVPKVGSGRRPFGIYTNYCPKGLILNGNIFDRNAKTTTTLDRGDNQYRDIYSNKDPNGPTPAGPVCLVNHFHLRGQDTTVQLRNGAGAGVVWDQCAGAGFSGGNGGAGWNTTAFLNGVNFVATDGSTVPGNQGPTINNSIRDNLNALSNAECSAGGIVEANVMLKAKAGASLTNARAPGVVGSNWTTKHDYIDRNNTAIGAASWLNSEDGFFFGGLRRENNVVDMRGTGKVNAIFTQLDYTGKATWFSAAGNAFFSDTPSQIALINTTPSSISAYQTMMGTDNPVVGTAPTFVEAARSLGSWAAANGQTGTDAAFYALARARAFRSSPAYLNAWEAAKYFAAGAVASNYAALGTGWLDKTGVVVGLPSARANGAYGLGTGNAVVLVATVSGATIAANGTSLTLNFTGNVINGSSFSGALSVTGVTGSINLAGLVPVVTSNSATIDFSSRGKVRSGQTVTVSVDVGSFTNTAATIAVPAYSGTATNNSTQTTVTRPSVSSVSCTATTVAFVFDENIATAPALTGALTAGSRTISLDGLSRSISTNTLTLNFSAVGIVYTGETVTARLDAEAVSSAANGGLSNAYQGSVTNSSATATPTFPSVVSVSCTASTIAFVFNETIAAGSSPVVGTVSLGSRGSIPLDSLSKSVAGSTLTLTFSKRGAVYSLETITASLVAGSVISASTSGASVAYSGAVTNSSTKPKPDPAIYLAHFNLFSGGVSSGTFYANAIHSHPLTQPFIVSKVDLSVSDAAAGSAMAAAVGAAKALVNATYAAAGKSFSYAMHWQNAGQTQGDGVTPYANTAALTENTGDKVTTTPALAGYSTPTTLAGRTALTPKMTTAVGSFNTDRISAGLEAPSLLLLDFESNLRMDLACGASPTAWLPVWLLDSRNASEVVDGTDTFATLLTNKRDLFNQVFSYDPTGAMYNNPTNYPLFSWLNGIRTKIIDWATSVSFRAPMQAAIAGVECAVYGIAASNRTNYQPGDKAYLYECEASEIYNDVQSLTLYPLTASAFQNTGSTYADQLARYGLTHTGNIQNDMGAIYIARSIAMIKRAAGASAKAQANWVMAPGHQEVFTTEYNGGGGTYTVTWEHVLQILQAGNSVGVDRWAIFCPNMTTGRLADLNTLVNAYSPVTPTRPSMHRNLKLIRDFVALAGTTFIDAVLVGDSNCMKDGAGHDHGLEYGIRSQGFKSYATPLFSAGENASVLGAAGYTGLGAGVGYGTTTDYGGDIANTNYVSYKANGSMSTSYIDPQLAYRNGTDKAHTPFQELVAAGLLQWCDTTDCGSWAPIAPLYKPESQAAVHWWSNPVGVRLGGGTKNPIDCTAALRAEIWIGRPSTGATSNDASECQWLQSTSSGGALSNIPVSPVIALRTDTGTVGKMNRQVHDMAANAARVDAEWRVPMGGASWWFKTYFRVYNPARTAGIAVTPLYAAGSQSTYDAANGLQKFPLTSFQHFFEALTYNQGATKRVFFHVTLGPNDLSEALKLTGAPAGLASSAEVVKYNLQRIVDRLKQAWAYTNTANGGGFAPENIVFLFQVHVPQTGANETMFAKYRSVCNDLCDADPTHLAHFDSSLAVTYAQLSANYGNPVFDSAGADPFHLGNRSSYEILHQLMWASIMTSSAENSIQSSGKAGEARFLSVFATRK